MCGERHPAATMDRILRRLILVAPFLSLRTRALRVAISWQTDADADADVVRTATCSP